MAFGWQLDGDELGPARKEELLRAFARAIRSFTGYIPGPDMGTDERCMAWIHGEIGRAAALELSRSRVGEAMSYRRP